MVECISWGDRHSFFFALLTVYQRLQGHFLICCRCVAYVAHTEQAC